MPNPTVDPALLETLKEDARSYLEANGMSEQEHTPGPWEVDSGGNVYPESLFGAESAQEAPPRIAKVSRLWVEAKNEFPGTFEGNRRLIAAAPELLEAAASYLHDPRPENADTLSSVITRAKHGRL